MDRTTRWIEAIAACISSVAAVVALVFVVTQIQFAREEFIEYKAERKNEKMDELYEKWSSPAMAFYRAKVGESYPNGTPHLLEVFAFFERLARSKANGIVAIDDLSYYFQDPLLTYWCGFEAWVRENRVNNGEHAVTGELWNGFETVVEEMRQEKQLKCLSSTEIEANMRREGERYAQLFVTSPTRSEPGVRNNK